MLREFTPNSKQIQVLPSPITKKNPTPLLKDSDLECLTEKIEISNLKKKIDALERINATSRTDLTKLKIENQDRVNENMKLLELFRNSSNKREGGSRRFRKHKRSAARRRSNASRRRHRTRK
jgi:uncharacterized protein YydD (DUF2326 family)